MVVCFERGSIGISLDDLCCAMSSEAVGLHLAIVYVRLRQHVVRMSSATRLSGRTWPAGTSVRNVVFMLCTLFGMLCVPKPGTGSAGLLLRQSMPKTALLRIEAIKDSKYARSYFFSRFDFHSTIDRHFQCRFKLIDPVTPLLSTARPAAGGTCGCNGAAPDRASKCGKLAGDTISLPKGRLLG